jgi:GTPase SAR1 family protein
MKRSLSANNIRKIPILKNIDDILRESENNIVLFGSVGNGKTFLLNKLCNKNYQTAEEGFSCTKDVQYSFSRICDMVIVDFPGLNSTRDFDNHLKVHKEALSTIPVRMICFVLKYSVRDDDYIREINQMLEIFEEYTENIMIIMSNTEGIKEERKEDIKYILKDYGLENVLFTEKLTNRYFLCAELSKIQKNMKNINNLRIDTNNLTKYVTSRPIKEITEKRKIFEQIFYEAMPQFKMEIEKTKDSDLIRALYFCFKDFKDMLYDQYAETLRSIKVKGKEIEEQHIISAVLQFSNKLYNEFIDFRKYVESKIEVKLNNFNGEFNKFKKCPHCGLIWFKVVGCDSVQCGKRTGIKDKYFGIYKKYKVSYNNKRIIIVSNDAGDNNYQYGNEFYGLTENEKTSNIERKKRGVKEIKPIGCGRISRWNEMEDCSEEVIKKLQEDSLSDD